MNTNPWFRDKGFTLIEIMLVLVVISVMASLLVVSIADNPAKQVEHEAKRLKVILQMAATEAQMQGVELALALTDKSELSNSGYQLLIFNLDDQRWQTLTDKQFLHYELPADISMTLRLRSDSRNALFEQQITKLKKLGNSQQLQPSLLLLSSGEITPFDIIFSHVGSSAITSIGSDGVEEIELK